MGILSKYKQNAIGMKQKPVSYLRYLLKEHAPNTGFTSGAKLCQSYGLNTYIFKAVPLPAILKILPFSQQNFPQLTRKSTLDLTLAVNQCKYVTTFLRRSKIVIEKK